jgi:DNA phosphorothioation-associated putative methyltransferase
MDPIPACLGVFYVFKDDKDREHFLSDKYIRQYVCRPRQYKNLEEKLEPYRELLEEFANTVGKLGRLPKSDEFSKYNELRQNIGSTKKALTFCERLFEDFNFAEIAENRYNDILVYFAVSMLRGKFKLKNMDDGIKKDIKIIFGSIAEVKAEASHLIHKLRDHKNIYQACAKAPVGKLLPDSLYIHIDYLDSLSPLLRLYVACATTFTGEMDDTTLIKINRNKRKISFLYYNNFDRDPHPELQHSIVVDLRYLTVKDWIQSKDNPPILHRKETFVGNNYPGFAKFAKLTRQEEKAGLFDTGEFIGRKQNWEEIVRGKGLKIKGYRVIINE